jgi:hypothetical protein
MLNHAYAAINAIRLHYVTSGAGKLIIFSAWLSRFLAHVEGSVDGLSMLPSAWPRKG